ncbi:LuxR family transcriptional regulator AbsR2 [Streptomyces griseosporeus]|uniref:LuxR family transcriptional regulator AbsR2 n=1 Tax=Streptomyces griseosporeus TaxID=1910 RepID=UPI00167DCB29|nr:LuxR C-terminal-related transcriptional regulator [Streptomyces griseosporeus]
MGRPAEPRPGAAPALVRVTPPAAPWPFTGREDELEAVRRCLAAGRPGLVVTGPAGCGRTRLAAEAVRGTEHTTVTGTPGARGTRYAAFAPLLPETATLHEAMHRLSAVRLLVVDDAHLLDDASAALVHQLAVHGRTRLLVLVTDGIRAPEAITRLWTGDLLPRLALRPLPKEETARLLGSGDTPLDPLTVTRLHGLARGDLGLLRDLLEAVRAGGRLTAVPGTDTHAWRGPVPVTAALRERTAPALDRACPQERETLDRLALAEPAPLDADLFDAGVLERLEADDLIEADACGAVRLAHPLHGAVLRATVGRLRARRLAAAPEDRALAVKAETAALARRVDVDDVRNLPTPVGEWLLAEGAPVPPAYAAARARFARLRGELRDAASWARQAPHDPACRTELALALAQSGAVPEATLAMSRAAPEDPTGRTPSADGSQGAPEPRRPGPSQGAPPRPSPGRDQALGTVAVWTAAARGDLAAALDALREDDPYDAVRLGRPERALGRLRSGSVFAAHADALARGDGPALDRAAEALRERGFLLFAAEAYAQAAHVHRDPGAARTARTRAVALARRCQGARTPALSGLVLGELTARQRQIVTLAAAGLTNRQIAERLTLSVRTVGNHLYSAYTRLGTGGDRGALPWLTETADSGRA